jgi:hypothetical protein
VTLAIAAMSRTTLKLKLSESAALIAWVDVIARSVWPSAEAMVWFAATGYCIMANMLYWLGAEPRLNPETAPRAAARIARCRRSVSAILAQGLRTERRPRASSADRPVLVEHPAGTPREKDGRRRRRPNLRASFLYITLARTRTRMTAIARFALSHGGSRFRPRRYELDH